MRPHRAPAPPRACSAAGGVLGYTMLYLLKTRFLHGPGPVYERAAARGRMLPEGVRFIDSWIVDDVSLDVCYEVVESADRALLDVWISRWADLIAGEVMPVIRSPEAAARVGRSWDGSAPPAAGAERTESEAVLDGGCCCAAVRYRVQGRPFHATLCHCSICRRTSGSPMVGWFSVRAGEFAFTAGEPASFSSSEHGTRRFCPRCGTQLTFHSTRYPDEVDVSTCSLDDPERVPPRDRTWTSAQVGWVADAAGLPRFANSRE